jgi:NAD(P)H-dependent flavin oxidoreductase YrpB (nitropropane dioxygenase family)
MMLRAAMVEGDLRFGVMASGQVVGVIDDLPSVAELIDRMEREAEETLKRLAGD